MSDIGPWLVVGGAALIVVCVAITLGAVVRALRRGRAPVEDTASARSALVDAAAESLEADELMPLLLVAAIEAVRADAAVVTFVRDGDRRRSYSANLNVREARTAIDALTAPEPVHESAGLPHERLVIPVERPGVSGALGVYWRDEGLREFLITDLEELVASAFRPLLRRVGTPQANEDEHHRSTVADFIGTLEPELLLQKIVAAAVTACRADAAAARIGGPTDEPISDVRGFAEHEREWVKSVLASEPLVSSITRYLFRADDSGAEPEASIGPAIGTAIVVPLRDWDGNIIGDLVAVWRRDLAAEGDGKVAQLEALAEDARAAMGNAVMFQRLHSIAVPDRSTAVKPATTAVVTEPMRLSLGEGAEDWTLRGRMPGNNTPGSSRDHG
jgi:hypothetical protein